MIEHTAAQVATLADVEQRAALAAEQIDTRSIGKIIGEVRRQVRRQARFEARRLHNLLHPLGADGALERCEQVRQHCRIAERTVALAALEAPSLDQRIEVVTIVLGKERPRQANCAEHRRRELLANAAELAAHEPVVEAGVVRNEEAPVEPRPDLGAQVVESGGVGDHLVGDAGEALDGRRDALAGIDETAPLPDDGAVVEQHDADLGDPVLGRRPPGRLEVDARDRPTQHGRSERGRPGTGHAAARSQSVASPSSVMIGP